MLLSEAKWMSAVSRVALEAVGINQVLELTSRTVDDLLEAGLMPAVVGLVEGDLHEARLRLRGDVATSPMPSTKLTNGAIEMSHSKLADVRPPPTPTPPCKPPAPPPAVSYEDRLIEIATRLACADVRAKGLAYTAANRDQGSFQYVAIARNILSEASGAANDAGTALP